MTQLESKMKIAKSEAGMISLIVVAAIGIIGAIGFEMLQWGKGLGPQDVDSALLFQTINLTRANILTLAKSYSPNTAAAPSGYAPAWNWTIYKSGTTGPANMSCIQGHSDCTGKQGAITLVGGQGNVFYDSTDPGAGFQLDGSPCPLPGLPYSATPNGPATGPSGCVLRADVNWTASCSGAPPCYIDPTASPSTNSVILTAAFKTPMTTGVESPVNGVNTILLDTDPKVLVSSLPSLNGYW